MENNGMITKKSEEENKKNKLLYATEKGLKLYSFIIRENEHSNSVALEGLTETEITTLVELLDKVKNNISEDWLYVKKGNKRNY